MKRMFHGLGLTFTKTGWGRNMSSSGAARFTRREGMSRYGPGSMNIQRKNLAVDLPLILVKNRPKTTKSSEMTMAQNPSIYGISAIVLPKGIRLPKPWVASSNLVARSSKFRPSGDCPEGLFCCVVPSVVPKREKTHKKHQSRSIPR